MSLVYGMKTRAKAEASSFFVRSQGKSSSRQEQLSVALPLIQPKLTVGAVDDEYEREADHVAETVMRMPEPIIQRAST